MYPLKVLHVIWSAEMGGIGKLVYNLIQKQSADHALEAGLLIAKPEGELLPDFKKLPIPVNVANLKSGSAFNLSIYTKCRKLMRRYDIIHFHSFNPLLAKAAISSRRKILYTEHGNFGTGRKIKISDRILRHLQRRFLNKYVDEVTYNSFYTQQVSTSTFGIQPKKSAVIYNGVPAGPSSCESGNTASKEPGIFLIASVGRLAKVKCFNRLIDAFSKLNIPQARLVILGAGPEENNLKQQITDLKLEQQVFLPGSGDAHSLLSKADLCVLPSTGEAFGLVAVEAYQQGKKVIAYHDGGGLTEIIKGIEPDALVASNDELTAILSACYASRDRLNSPEETDKRKTYARQFSIEKMSSALTEIYKSL